MISNIVASLLPEDLYELRFLLTAFELFTRSSCVNVGALILSVDMIQAKVASGTITNMNDMTI